MFVGMDLRLSCGEEYLSISGFDRKDFYVKSPNGYQRIASGSENDFNYQRYSKVSPYIAFINNLSVREEYTVLNHPDTQAARTDMLLRDSAQLSIDKASRAVVEQMAAESAVRAASSDTSFGAAQRLAYLQGQLDSANSAVSSSTMASGIYDDNYRNDPKFRDHSRYPHDSVDISFEINASELIRDPYIVLLVDVIPDSNTDAEPVTWVHFRNLPDLKPEVNRIRYMDAGFPDGYLVDSYQVLLFGNGAEVATNLSQKRVGLPKDQALTFLMFQYQQEHAGETLDPEPISGFFPYDKVLGMHPDLAQCTMTFKVAANGIILGVDIPKEFQKHLTTDIQYALLHMDFFPALEKGKAVDGEVSLVLADRVL